MREGSECFARSFQFAPPVSRSHRKLKDGAWKQLTVKAVWGTGERLRVPGDLQWRLGGLAEHAWSENHSGVRYVKRSIMPD